MDEDKQTKRREAKATYLREYRERGGHGPCNAEGCDRPSLGKSGLCTMHYQRQRLADRAAGLPSLSQRRRDAAPERFWAKVDRHELVDCWEWLAARVHGYGVFRVNGRSIGAHRYAYEQLRGPIPLGLEIDHLCRNRGCVNPWHMEPVTKSENLMRGEGMAARNARKTHCKNGHLLEGNNVYCPPSKTTGRYCRICMQERQRERNRRKRLNQ